MERRLVYPDDHHKASSSCWNNSHLIYCGQTLCLTLLSFNSFRDLLCNLRHEVKPLGGLIMYEYCTWNMTMIWLIRWCQRPFIGTYIIRISINQSSLQLCRWKLIFVMNMASLITGNKFDPDKDIPDLNGKVRNSSLQVPSIKLSMIASHRYKSITLK